MGVLRRGRECGFTQKPALLRVTGRLFQTRVVYLSLFRTNLTYNLKHSNYFNIPGLLREVVVIEEGGSPAYLLGREYGYEAKEQFVAHFRSTIWFSYRKNIPAVGDDTGWGCMIRSAMMMVAEAAKRSTGMQPVNVLKHFKEKENGMYSFAALCK